MAETETSAVSYESHLHIYFHYPTPVSSPSPISTKADVPNIEFLVLSKNYGPASSFKGAVERDRFSKLQIILKVSPAYQ